MCKHVNFSYNKNNNKRLIYYILILSAKRKIKKYITTCQQPKQSTGKTNKNIKPKLDLQYNISGELNVRRLYYIFMEQIYSFRYSKKFILLYTYYTTKTIIYFFKKKKKKRKHIQTCYTKLPVGKQLNEALRIGPHCTICPLSMKHFSSNFSYIYIHTYLKNKF